LSSSQGAFLPADTHDRKTFTSTPAASSTSPSPPGPPPPPHLQPRRNPSPSSPRSVKARPPGSLPSSSSSFLRRGSSSELNIVNEDFSSSDIIKLNSGDRRERPGFALWRLRRGQKREGGGRGSSRFNLVSPSLLRLLLLPLSLFFFRGPGIRRCLRLLE